MTNQFGVIPISDTQQKMLKVILHKFADYRPERDDPKYFQDVDPNGSLTDMQWRVVDALSVPMSDKPTIMELTEEMDKRSISSIQKPRDAGRKKIIEAIITMAHVLQDEDILKYFMGNALI